MNATDQNIPKERPRWRISIAAVVIGGSLGLLPHVLGLFLGMANFLLTPVLVPVLAVACGWWLCRRFPEQRWRSISLASASAGLAYVGGILGQLSALAQINGAWLQTLPAAEAIRLMIGATAVAALFISIGCLLSMWMRRPQPAHR